MTPSITVGKKFLIIVFWIIIWQIIASVLNQPILLSSPIAVAIRLTELVRIKSFWISIFNTVYKICLGFACGFLLASSFAIISYKFKIFSWFIEPVITLIKSIPVASFIVLALVWIKTKNLSLFISGLIVFPIVYNNILSGLLNIDKKMIEMSTVFKISMIKKIKMLYIDGISENIKTCIGIGIGFAFKSGIAAEILGISRNTIGEAIYSAKISFETVDVFAWTVVIIFISIGCERVAKFIVSKWL